MTTLTHTGPAHATSTATKAGSMDALKKRFNQSRADNALPRGLKGSRLVRRYIYLCLVAVLLIAPLVLPLLSAFKSPGEQIFGPSATLFPKHWSIQAFKALVTDTNILPSIGNSLIVCCLSVTSHVILSTVTGYMLSRKGWKGRFFFTTIVLMALMFPFEAVMLSLYALIADIHLLDTLIGVWVPGLMGAFQVLLMRTAFLSVPDEIEDAALIDGAGEWKRFWKVFLPQAKGAVVIVALTSFIYAWQDYLWPLLIITSSEKKTMILAIATLQSSFVTDYRVVLAGAIAALTPTILVFFSAQKYFFKGIEDGGLKF